MIINSFTNTSRDINRRVTAICRLWYRLVVLTLVLSLGLVTNASAVTFDHQTMVFPVLNLMNLVLIMLYL